MYEDSAISPDTNKPEMIMDYNAAKGGVDTVDKICNTYSVNRRTRRWPVVIFFQSLNIWGINSQIFYNTTNIAVAQTYELFWKT